MAEGRPNYMCYLLRMWREDEGEAPVWRASLQSHRDTARRGFASLEDLFEFLRRQTGVSADQDAPTPHSGVDTGIC
ncbi:MAG: hypothetical protein ACK2UO_03900 [Caldilineaceae bacterium]|jgi:hypothetical protein